MHGKIDAWKLCLLALAAVAVLVVVLVMLAVDTRSTQELIDDLASTDRGQLKSALDRLTAEGPERLPELIRSYKESADLVHRKRIIRVITRMYKPENRSAVIPALIELLSFEKALLLRQEIVGGLRMHTGRLHLNEDPLGDDADAWHGWWQEQSGAKAQDQNGTKER